MSDDYRRQEDFDARLEEIQRTLDTVITGEAQAEHAKKEELGREPASEEIAKRMDIPVSKVRKILKIAQEPISLETPIGEEEDSHLGDFIEDRSAVPPAENVINLKEQTDALLKTLTPREELVIKTRLPRSPARGSARSRPRRSASSATPAAPASSRPSWRAAGSEGIRQALHHLDLAAVAAAELHRDLAPAEGPPRPYHWPVVAQEADPLHLRARVGRGTVRAPLRGNGARQGGNTVSFRLSHETRAGSWAMIN